MQLHEEARAYTSLKEAVNREPDNLEYRIMALDAAIALKQSNTLHGKLKALFRRQHPAYALPFLRSARDG